MIVLLFPNSILAQIPDSLKFDWHRAGLDSGFQEPSTIIDMTTIGAIPNDGISDSPALLNAIQTLPTGGAILFFPPGIYHFTATVQMPSNCIVRGSGSDSTVFSFNLNNTQSNSFNFSGSTQSGFFPIRDTLFRGGNVVSIDSAASSAFTAGERIEIRQLNGSWDTNPASWAQYAVGHISTVDSVVGSLVYLRDALRFNVDTSLAPEIRVVNCVENSGIECAKILRTDSLAPGVNCGIYLNLSYNIRIRGVHGFKSIAAHVLVERSSHVEISGSYFQESYDYTGSNTRGYGVVMGEHATLCKVENNIFRKLRHAMMVKQGANGNVFAYNYSIEPNRSEFPSNYGADICVHGHYPFANLFEGNICQNIIIDQAWGPNGPNNAYFRNRAELYGFIISSGTVQSDKQSIVGNDITSTAFFQGQYTLNGIGHFQMANRVQGNVIPSGTNQLAESSLFLNSPPLYWGNLPWPGIGIPFTLASQSIPAAIRYNTASSKTICGDPDTLFSSAQDPISASVPNVYFAADGLYVDQHESQLNVEISLYDLSGRCVFKRDDLSSIRFPIYMDIPSGVYVLRYNADGKTMRRKLVKLDD
jgi:hypothetical protein